MKTFPKNHFGLMSDYMVCAYYYLINTLLTKIASFDIFSLHCYFKDFVLSFGFWNFRNIDRKGV